MTLKDVAEHAGVALDTARRALQGAPSVRPYIRERVLRAANTLDYHPNLLARALKENALRVVPITVYHLDQIYFGSLAGHLSTSLVEAGMEPALCFDPEHLLRMSRTLSTNASILVAGFDETIIRSLSQRQKVVTIGGDVKPIANVGCIEVRLPPSYRFAVETLLASGRRRIALCSSYHAAHVAHGWREPKFETVMTVLREAGERPVGPSPNPVFETPDEVGLWLDAHPGSIDAIFCPNDTEGAQMVGVLAARGMRTPNDVLVIGCDDNLRMPGMWSFAVETSALARAAVDLLQRLLAGKARVPPQVFTPRLVDHTGTAIVAPAVAKPSRTGSIRKRRAATGS